jgi:diguanylate cyclase (GGDEF)-like protein
MRFEHFSKQSGFGPSGYTVLLVSADTLLTLDLERTFNSLGQRLETVQEGTAALAALESLENSAVVLLDLRLDFTASLLAAMHASGVHRRCAIALVAEQVSDEWIARLREGMVDDIVPRNADAGTWNKHLSSMRRGHRILCELGELRAASLMEVQHDRLTGIFNRETMMHLLFRETDRVQRLRGALCLMVFDMDDFAHWNAEIGSAACDALLREVSLRTGRMLRSYDLLGRAGADEFLLALPGCSVVNASLLAERLRMEVFGEPFLVQTEAGEMLSVRLTASFGIAVSRGRSPVVVVREAEQTLALARRAGPDSILCAGEMPQAQLVSEAAMLV